MSQVWTQYQRLKAQAPGCILLFRYGDFYEMFGDDAETAAPVLDMALAWREMGRGNRVRMAGFPHHALPSHLPKLLNAGFRVAVVEQNGPIEEDGARGLMDRELARIVSAGTVVEPGLLEERSNNYLAAVVVGRERVGLAYADVTTGEFAACQLDGARAQASLQQEIERLRPAEVLLPRPDDRSSPADQPALPSECHLTHRDAWHFELDGAREALLRHFGVTSLEAFGCERLPLATRAAGALVQYVAETQRSAAAQLNDLRVYTTDGYMALDSATRRNLELLQSGREGTTRGSLLWVLDETKTAPGARLLRRWISQPLTRLAPLEERQAGVAELHADLRLRSTLRELLGRVGDLERLINRVGQRAAGARDLLALRSSLLALAELRLLPLPEAGAERTARLLGSLDPCAEIADLIGRAIVPEPPNALGEGIIARGFSPELDELIESSRHAREWIAGLEAKEREATGIRGLKVGYNRVFGYYLEVTNANRDLAPARYVRKQTLVGAERYITPELKEYESLVLGAQERISELESSLFRQVCAEVAGVRGRVLRSAEAIARLDVFASLAEVAARHRYVRPVLRDDRTLRIVAGRHPVVELARRDEPFVPNDVSLSGDGAQIILLTGPNMAGKSTYLRMVALIVLLAQIGGFVPAEAAEIGIVDRIFTRIGAQDDLGAGQSTFLVEMIETAALLTQSTPKSLLILDEVGRGTSTYDGLAIAQSVVEHIHNHPRIQARTLFATHYHELTELEKVLPRVRNCRVDVREEGEKVTFLHRVVAGGADRSYGIHVARLAGIPRGVTRRAEEILRELEEGKPARGRPQRRREAEPNWQLALFLEPDPIVEELKALDTLSLTPIEALTKLFELQQKARGAPSANSATESAG